MKKDLFATIKTNRGDIKIRLYPDIAPKTCENFATLAKKGYYDGVIFHRVIKEFMIQGGDPTGTGCGGESCWGGTFEDECDPNVSFDKKGLIAMANAGPGTNGSQFFINYQNPSSFPGWERFQQMYDVYIKNPSVFEERYGSTVDMSKVTESVKKLYSEKGGSPHLDGYYNTAHKGHTVFGQVFEGLDVVEKISKVETDENNRPKKDVKIEYISIEEYNN